MKAFAPFCATASAVLLVSCSQPGVTDHRNGAAVRATARLEATRGNAAAGTVAFRQQDASVMVLVSLTGLKPNAEHGFHVHDNGDCSSGDGMSAGGHFNPTKQPHGPQHAEHHAGDMPALKTDANGSVRATFHLTGVSLGSGPVDLVGHSLIVHADADDYTTQPTGNSGARIACGVIARD